MSSLFSSIVVSLVSEQQTLVVIALKQPGVWALPIMNENGKILLPDPLKQPWCIISFYHTTICRFIRINMHYRIKNEHICNYFSVPNPIDVIRKCQFNLLGKFARMDPTRLPCTSFLPPGLALRRTVNSGRHSGLNGWRAGKHSQSISIILILS
jgi:hypothetical protein